MSLVLRNLKKSLPGSPEDPKSSSGSETDTDQEDVYLSRVQHAQQLLDRGQHTQAWRTLSKLTDDERKRPEASALLTYLHKRPGARNVQHDAGAKRPISQKRLIQQAKHVRRGPETESKSIVTGPASPTLQKQGLPVWFKIAAPIALAVFLLCLGIFVGVRKASLASAPPGSAMGTANPDTFQHSAAERGVPLDVVQAAEETAPLHEKAPTPLPPPIVLPAASEPTPQVTARKHPAQQKQSPSWLNVRIPGTTMLEEDGILTIQFDDGVFSMGSVLTPEARDILIALGTELETYVNHIKVVIVGHTDDIPLGRGAPYESNYELGLERARAVARFLRNHSRMPKRVFGIQSYGSKKPPFPNNSSVNKSRNRTVTIRVQEV